MDLGLQDRVYVVTGASRGLGLATATVLAAEGARVLMCARDDAALQKATDSLDAGDRSMALPGDLSDTALGERLAAAAIGRWGRLDGVLVSVGGPAAGETLGLTDEAWRAGFETVFLGALRIARACDRGDGRGRRLAGVRAVHLRQAADRRAGGLERAAARPGHAGQDDGRRARAAEHPGQRPAARPDRHRPGPRARRHRREGPQGADASPSRGSRCGRYGEPAEFGRVAAFLLSPAASFVSGTMVPVDGGMMRAL